MARLPKRSTPFRGSSRRLVRTGTGRFEGLPELVDALDGKLSRENGLDLSQSRVVVTAGGNMAFMNAVLAIADPGDEVILQTPFYFNHEMAIVMAGCRAVAVPTDDRYQLQVDRSATRSRRERAPLSRSRRTTRPVPSTRIGPATRERDLRRARVVAHPRRGLRVLHLRSLPPRLAGRAAGRRGTHDLACSLSKAYGSASWRIGYMVIPERLWMAVNKIQDTLLICPPHVSQAAAVGALAAGRAYCDQHVRTLAVVRDLVLARIGEIGDLCEAPSADGAFYCMLRVHTAMPAMTLAERLTREHRVAAAPGTAFGLEKGCHLRVSVHGALAPETVEQGNGRLVTGLRTLVGGMSVEPNLTYVRAEL